MFPPDEPFIVTATCPEAAADCLDFSRQTGHTIRAGFLAYWQAFGGLPIFGYPISEEYVDPETGRVVQYFERARFEWQPGAWLERYDVLLGRLGVEVLGARGRSVDAHLGSDAAP